MFYTKSVCVCLFCYECESVFPRLCVRVWGGGFILSDRDNCTVGFWQSESRSDPSRRLRICLISFLGSFAAVPHPYPMQSAKAKGAGGDFSF